MNDHGHLGHHWHGYYLTAYGIAVKRGFPGTEQEWLESLKGEPGAAAELRYNRETDMLQWKNAEEEEWHDLIPLEEIRGNLITETLEAAAESALENGAYAKEQGDRAQELIEEIKNTDVGDLAAEVAGMRSAMPGVLIEDIEIPAAGWEEDPTLAAYPYAAVVNMEKATAQMSPVVALKLGSLETARVACLCPSVEAQDGAIKLWAKKTPTADMIATVTLLSEGAVQGSGGESPGGGDYVLPVATRTRLGGVKIGSDVDVAADGTISVNTDEITATDAEVQEMLENTLQ